VFYFVSLPLSSDNYKQVATFLPSEELGMTATSSALLAFFKKSKE
jgi:hypothetical protein